MFLHFKWYTVNRFLWEHPLPFLGHETAEDHCEQSGEAEGGRKHEGCVFVSGQCGHKVRAP